MIGRAAIGNPWIFDEIKYYFKYKKNKKSPSLKDRIKAVKTHLLFSIKWKGEKLGLIEMRRHYSNYFRGIANFKEHRLKLIHSENIKESIALLDEIYNIYSVNKTYVVR